MIHDEFFSHRLRSRYAVSASNIPSQRVPDITLESPTVLSRRAWFSKLRSKSVFCPSVCDIRKVFCSSIESHTNSSQAAMLAKHLETKNSSEQYYPGLWGTPERCALSNKVTATRL